MGELSRAVQALYDTKVVQGTPDTIAALQAKHPAAPPAARLDNDEDAWERAKETLPFLADIQPADVIKALKSATKGAAQDCMGWRVEWSLIVSAVATPYRNNAGLVRSPQDSPKADIFLTGRKILVYNYGGASPQGCG